MTAGRPRSVYLEDLSEAVTLKDHGLTWTAISELLGIEPGTLRAAFHVFRAGRPYPNRPEIHLRRPENSKRPFRREGGDHGP